MPQSMPITYRLFLLLYECHNTTQNSSRFPPFSPEPLIWWTYYSIKKSFKRGMCQCRFRVLLGATAVRKAQRMDEWERQCNASGKVCVNHWGSLGVKNMPLPAASASFWRWREEKRRGEEGIGWTDAAIGCSAGQTQQGCALWGTLLHIDGKMRGCHCLFHSRQPWKQAVISLMHN